MFEVHTLILRVLQFRDVLDKSYWLTASMILVIIRAQISIWLHVAPIKLSSFHSIRHCDARHASMVSLVHTERIDPFINWDRRHRFSECRIFRRTTAAIAFASNSIAANSNGHNACRPARTIREFSPPTRASIAATWSSRDAIERFARATLPPVDLWSVRFASARQCQAGCWTTVPALRIGRFRCRSNWSYSNCWQNWWTPPRSRSARNEEKRNGINFVDERA